MTPRVGVKGRKECQYMALMDYQSMTFGQRVRYLRTRANLTQAELGLACGANATHINRLERGAEYNPQLSSIRRIAAALGVTCGGLLD